MSYISTSNSFFHHSFSCPKVNFGSLRTRQFLLPNIKKNFTKLQNKFTKHFTTGFFLHIFVTFVEKEPSTTFYGVFDYFSQT